MKYLVNRKTKQHVIAPANHRDLFSAQWDVVEADAEGWIKWDGGECPLPERCRHEVKYRCGDIGSDYSPEIWNWGFEPDDPSYDIIAYRPILDKPEDILPQETAQAGVGVNERSTDDLITRLKSAHEAAQSIPDLLAELREVLGSMGYDVVARSPFVPFTPSSEFEHQTVDDELTKNITVYSGGGHTEPDMSDWRNWREGDKVRCLDSFGWGGRFLTGQLYTVEKLTPNRIIIAGQDIGRHVVDFRFHSRPEVKA